MRSIVWLTHFYMFWGWKMLKNGHVLGLWGRLLSGFCSKWTNMLSSIIMLRVLIVTEDIQCTCDRITYPKRKDFGISKSSTSPRKNPVFNPNSKGQISNLTWIDSWIVHLSFKKETKWFHQFQQKLEHRSSNFLPWFGSFPSVILVVRVTAYFF